MDKFLCTVAGLALGFICNSVPARAIPPPQVSAVSPHPHIINAEAGSAIEVSFSGAIDPQSVNNSTFNVFGRWSGVMPGIFSFENNNTRVLFTPSRGFFAGEYITVSLSRGIADSSGQPMASGYAWSFWIKTSPGSMSLLQTGQISVRRPGEGWIQTYGAYAGDLNGDGFSDFTVPNERSNDVRVFLNDGSGGYGDFTVHPLPNANRPSTNEGADFNGDGLMDFAVGSTANNRVNVLLGDGEGGFSASTSYVADMGVRGLSVLDLEGDGDADIVTANRTGNNLSLFLNNGDGSFAPAINIEGGGNQESACAAADANGDGILDLFVGCYASDDVILLLGDGNGGFVFSDAVAGGDNPWMVVTGDVDGDGHVDVAVANAGGNNAAVIRGDGNGNLLPAVTYASGANFPLSIDLGDLDGDGDLDMILSNYGNNAPGSGKWRVYENDGSGNFINPQDYPAGTAASCAVFHDRNHDGFMDVTGIDEIDDLLILFENTATAVAIHPHPVLESFALRQNYPNPFNPSTSISYQLSDPSDVAVTIHNTLGQKVKTLVTGRQAAGVYTVQWNGKDEEGNPLASGIYIYRMEAHLLNPSQAGAFSQSRKMVLLR